MSRRLAISGLAVMLFLLLPPAWADEDTVSSEAQAISRERLIEEAKRAIEGSGLGDLASALKVVEGLRDTWRELRAVEGASDSVLDARLAWLLGPAEVGEGEEAWGALMQAIWLAQWLEGTETGARYALRAPAVDDAVPEPELYTPAEWQELAAEERTRLLSTRALDLARLSDGGFEPPSHVALQAVVTVGAGEDARQVSLDPVAGLRNPPALDDGRVLVNSEELHHETSETWLRARAEQVAVHLAEWSAEQPSDLVTRAGVSRRRERVARIEAELERWEAIASRLKDALDEMVEEDLDRNRRVFALEGRIRDAKEAPGADDATTGAGRALARLSLDELQAKLEQRLLALAVARAERHLALVGRTEDLLEREKVVAATVQDRFEQRLRRVQREAQRARLRQDRGWFETLREQARNRADDEQEPQREVWRRYATVLDGIVGLNLVLAELVDVVQSLEGYPDVPESSASISGAEAESEGEAPGSGDPAPAAERPDDERPDLGVLLEPDKYVHQSNFVAQARAALSNPAFDVALVARTYTAADRFIESRSRTVEDSERAETLAADYESRDAPITKELEDLASQLPSYMAWDLRQIQTRRQPYDELLQRAMADIQKEREVARQQIADLRAICADLTGLGERSLGIRANRDLSPRSLREAEATASRAIARAWRWLTFQDQPNLGSFLLARWLQILLTFLVALAFVAAVHAGRRGIDRRLEKLGREIPALRQEGVTVAGETADVREIRKHEQEVAAEAEASALADASRKTADQPPPEVAASEEDASEDTGGDGGQRG